MSRTKAKQPAGDDFWDDDAAPIVKVNFARKETARVNGDNLWDDEDDSPPQKTAPPQKSAPPPKAAKKAVTADWDDDDTPAPAPAPAPKAPVKAAPPKPTPAPVPAPAKVATRPPPAPVSPAIDRDSIIGGFNTTILSKLKPTVEAVKVPDDPDDDWGDAPSPAAASLKNAPSFKAPPPRPAAPAAAARAVPPPAPVASTPPAPRPTPPVLPPRPAAPTLAPRPTPPAAAPRPTPAPSPAPAPAVAAAPPRPAPRPTPPKPAATPVVAAVGDDEDWGESAPVAAASAVAASPASKFSLKSAPPRPAPAPRPIPAATAAPPRPAPRPTAPKLTPAVASAAPVGDDEDWGESAPTAAVKAAPVSKFGGMLKTTPAAAPPRPAPRPSAPRPAAAAAPVAVASAVDDDDDDDDNDWSSTKPAKSSAGAPVVAASAAAKPKFGLKPAFGSKSSPAVVEAEEETKEAPLSPVPMAAPGGYPPPMGQFPPRPGQFMPGAYPPPMPGAFPPPMAGFAPMPGQFPPRMPGFAPMPGQFMPGAYPPPMPGQYPPPMAGYAPMPGQYPPPMPGAYPPPMPGQFPMGGAQFPPRPGMMAPGMAPPPLPSRPSLVEPPSDRNSSSAVPAGAVKSGVLGMRRMNSAPTPAASMEAPPPLAPKPKPKPAGMSVASAAPPPVAGSKPGVVPGPGSYGQAPAMASPVQPTMRGMFSSFMSVATPASVPQQVKSSGDDDLYKGEVLGDNLGDADQFFQDLEVEPATPLTDEKGGPPPKPKRLVGAIKMEKKEKSTFSSMVKTVEYEQTAVVDVIKEGQLIKISTVNQTESLYLFTLTNKVFVYTELANVGNPDKLRLYDLTKMMAFDNEADYDDEFCFRIMTKEKSFRLRAKTVKERQTWVSEIVKACTAVQTTDLGKVLAENDLAPMFDSKKDASECQLCKKSFSFMGIGTPRHHCRNCGRIVCEACSREKVRIPRLDDKSLLKVCNTCAKDLKNNRKYGH